MQTPPPSELANYAAVLSTVFSGSTLVMIGKFLYQWGRLHQRVDDLERRTTCLEEKEAA